MLARVDRRTLASELPRVAPPTPWRLRLTVGLVTAALAVASVLLIDDPVAGRAAALAIVCIGLWLGEIVPAFVPTLVLLVGTAAGLGAPGSTIGSALASMADPVLALFFGGFVLGEAASAHGLDRVILRRAVEGTGGRARALVVVVMAVTAFLSMWMSNIAAAALMIASLKPALDAMDDGTRRALLVAVAFGANLGGMATPIGTGPNAIAIGAIEDPPSFVHWMAFALPLTVLSLAVALLLIVVRHGARGTVVIPEMAKADAQVDRPGVVAAIAVVTIAAWLTEPFHHLPAAGVSLACATVLFGSGLLAPARLRALDWSTLFLVAGGIGIGQLLEGSGLLGGWSGALAASEAPRWMVVLGLLFAAAAMSAVMSNTASAALLVPIALAIEPGSRSLPILVALAASFGMPFVMSTPPNAMVVGAGARSADLLVPGMILLVFGCLVLAATGPTVLALFGF